MRRLLWTMGLAVFAVLASKVAQSQGGLAVGQAGIHFTMPLGFEITVVERTGELGPFTMFLLEPRNGVVNGQPSSAFMTLESYQSTTQTLEAVMAQRVAVLSATFPDSGGVATSDAEYTLGERTESGLRLDWTLAGVPLQGHLIGRQEGDTILLVYFQGRPTELAGLEETFAHLLASAGVGAAPPPAPETPDSLGTGEGTGP